MDTQRLVLFFVFSFSLLMLWESWQKENRPPPAQAVAQSAATAVPTVTPGAAPPAPTAVPAAPGAAMARPDAVPGASTAPATAAREKIQVRTDVLVAEFDTQGGDLVYLEFLDQKDIIDPKKNLVLLSAQHKYAVQSGLIGTNLPNHRTLFTSTVKEAVLADGKDTVELKLEAVSADGVKVTKTYVFSRGSHLIEMRQDVLNGSAQPLASHAYFQITRDNEAPPGDSAMMQTYTGAAVYTDQEKFHKVAFSDIEKGKAAFPKTPDNGWVAILQHYFTTALVPSQKQREVYMRKLDGNLFAVGVILPLPTIAPGATTSVSVPLYSGPNDQDKLKAISPGLELVVDYGWLTVIAAPLFWVLQHFHGWVGNWGVAIILLTLGLKLLFYPLSAASYRSMAKMKLVAPRLAKLKEQYGEDRMKLNQAMMEMYKQEKINPLGGCLPIVVQIPVFISLYWVLLASVELRQAPFYGWIHDLSAQDPYYVLPVLMMISMVFQTKMNPTPPDPVQAKVMMIMPFVFGVMFFFFPAGLVLYWLVNNVLSIAQQWQITRMVEGARKTAVAKR
jgi:YidC/Oxa1 family membrane protein insertase